MKLFHTLLYPLLGLLFLSCSDNEQETGDNPAPTTGTITFGVDLTGFTTRVTQDGKDYRRIGYAVRCDCAGRPGLFLHGLPSCVRPSLPATFCTYGCTLYR